MEAGFCFSAAHHLTAAEHICFHVCCGDFDLEENSSVHFVMVCKQKQECLILGLASSEVHN